MAFERATIGFHHIQAGLRALAVGDDSPIEGRQHLLYVFVIQAEDCRAIKRNLLHELNKCSTDLDDGWIVVQVFVIDVRHNGQNRAQLEKRSIALVGLHH